MIKTYKKLESEKLKEKDEKLKEGNKDPLNNNEKERLKNNKEKNNVILMNIFNFIFSFLFLGFTLISVFTQKSQDKNFFSRIPLQKKLSDIPFPNFTDTHYTIMEDFLKRYEFTFNIYNNLMIKKNNIDDDLIPISTFRISVSRTKLKDCRDIFFNIFKSGNCSEPLYVPFVYGDKNKLFDKETVTLFNNPKKKYEIIDQKKNGTQALEAIDLLKNLYDKYFLKENNIISDEVNKDKLFIIVG